MIATKLSHKVYGNKVSGDICEKCYNKKRKFFQKNKILKTFVSSWGKKFLKTKLKKHVNF